MLGFVIGTLCLVGLVKVIRHGRHGRWGRGWGGGAWGRRPRAFLNRIFERLDTSPSQEKVIVAAVDELREAMGALRGEASRTRAEVARMLEGESFDAERMGSLFVHHDDELRKVRESFAGAFGKVHAALDPAQRATLARMIESGPFGHRRHGGPYRESVHV